MVTDSVAVRVVERMNVTILSYDFGEYCIRLASAVSRQASVQLLLPADLAAPHRSLLDDRVAFSPFTKPRLRQPVRQLRAIRQILGEIREFRPDVLHLQQGHLWFNLALPRLRHVPLVVTVHDPVRHLGDRGAQKTPQAVMAFGFRRAARLITHAESLKRALVDSCCIPEDVIHVIPHIKIGDDPDASPPHDAERLVLFFGRIWPYKGLEYLIKAEPRISAQVPDVQFVIAGMGEEFGCYRQMMTHPDRFTVLNRYISDDEVPELFKRASVVVLPYRTASQSGVISLAYSFGRPVVATTVGGLPEMVEDGKTGFLVPPQDEMALADAVIRLLQDAPLRRCLGRNARRKIEAECSPAVVARQTLDVYAHALRDRSSHAGKWKGG